MGLWSEGGGGRREGVDGGNGGKFHCACHGAVRVNET